MKANVGNIDRVVRVVLGLALLSLLLLGEANLRWLGLIGIVLIVTALIRFCPLYSVIGVDTRDRGNKH